MSRIQKLLWWLFGINSLWGKLWLKVFHTLRPVYIPSYKAEAIGETPIPKERTVPEDPGEKEDKPYPETDKTPKVFPVDRVMVIKKHHGRGFHVFPCFLPDLLVNRKFRYRDIKSFVKRFVDCKAGNSMRFFTSAVPEPKLVREMLMPFRKDSGIYQLPAPTASPGDFYRALNKKWLNMVVSRLKVFLDARIFTIIELIDNCSLHIHRPGYWNAHWLNPANNNQDFPRDPEAVVYHYYEYWAGGVHENHHPQNVIDQYTRVGTFLEKFWTVMMDAIIASLSPTQLQCLGISAGNEVKAGIGWHGRMLGLIHQALKKGSPKMPRAWRVFTSPWIHPTKTLPDSEVFHLTRKKLMGFRQIVHGIYSEKERNHAALNCSDKGFIASHDGNAGSPKALALKVLMLNLIEKGQSGYELMEGVWEQYYEHEQHGGPAYDMTKIDLNPGSFAMREFRRLARNFNIPEGQDE
jgi:hypothetical protein